MPSQQSNVAGKTGNILIIHEQIKVRTQFKRIISLEGYKVFEAADTDDASIIAIREAIEVILFDDGITARRGLNTEKEKEIFPYAEIISFPLNAAVEEDAHLLLSAIHTALEKIRLEKRIVQMEEWAGRYPEIDNIIGESSVIRETVAMAKKMAQTNDAILLQGETGTGKELFARAIHDASARKNSPFITLNCTAFTGTALEIELFGCKAGAYPGITKNKKGLLEKACKGSLLLNDIAELDKNLQLKLLQALTNNNYIKPGDTRPTPINIRLFTTSEKELRTAVQERYLDEDLFYIISLFTLNIPPLRDRKMDIPLLARRFIKYFARTTNKKVTDMSKDFLYHLQKYSWKGNIRELKNVMERAMIMTESDILTEDNLPFDIRYASEDTANHESAFDLKNVEMLHLKKVLKYTRGNKVEAAKLLNIGLTTLYRKINEYTN